MSISEKKNYQRKITLFNGQFWMVIWEAHKLGLHTVTNFGVLVKILLSTDILKCYTKTTPAWGF